MKKLNKVIIIIIILLCIVFGKKMDIQAGEFVTIQTFTGNGYVATVNGNDSSSTRYFSTSTGYNSGIADKIAAGQWYNNDVSYSYGSKSSSKVPLFTNVYFPEGSYMKFDLTGTSCSHAGSSATVYVTKPNGTEVKAGDLTISAGSKGSPSSKTIRYEITEAGYYTAKAVGYCYL